MDRCPLCGSHDNRWLVADTNRDYFRCLHCALIYADPTTHLASTQEKLVYDQHRNNSNDAGYRQFLARLATPLVMRLPLPPLFGLDFGSGPGPTLSVMLAEMGYTMTIYDPYFAAQSAVLACQYDFVTCTEAIEHFYQPAKEWGLLLRLVKPGGWLGIMTKLVTDTDAFGHWYYKNDPTHVSFFSRDTFCFLAQRDGLEVEFVGNDVILLRKPQ